MSLHFFFFYFSVISDGVVILVTASVLFCLVFLAEPIISCAVAGLLLSLLLISNDYSSLAVKKTFFSLLLLCMISAILQMFIDIRAEDLNEAFYFSSNQHLGGGAVGGWICSLLYQEIGLGGTIVIVFFLSLISVILITERSFLSFLRKVTAPFMKKGKKKKRKRAQGTRTKARDFGKVQPKKWLHKIPDLKIGRPKPEEASAEVPQTEKSGNTAVFEFSSDRGGIKGKYRIGSSSGRNRTGSDSGTEPVREVREKKSKKLEEPAEVEILPAAREDGSYVFPAITLLQRGNSGQTISRTEKQKTANKLQQTLENFGVHVKIDKYSCGHRSQDSNSIRNRE